MELLLRVEDRGYPTEYLLARIRGKRSRLISDWSALIFSGRPIEYLASPSYSGFVTSRTPGGFTGDLMKEYLWAYLRMNGSLRAIFSRFFIYSELRTIYVCLRLVNGGKATDVPGVLSASLLSGELKKALREAPDAAAAVAEVERAFLGLSDAFAGLAGSYHAEGLRGFELELTTRYLVTTVDSGLHPLMKDFFARIIDSRNIIALSKYLNLAPETPPAFVPGGSMREVQFLGIIEKRDFSEVLRLAGLEAAGPGAGSHIESSLYRGISLFLRRRGRDPLGIGPLLDYLWRASIEVMNFGILSYGRELDREEIRLELVH